MQVGEETWLPPARQRHHMRVPDQDDGLEGRTDDLVWLIGVELVDEGVAEFDDRLGYLAHSGHCHANSIPKAMGAARCAAIPRVEAKGRASSLGMGASDSLLMTFRKNSSTRLP